MKPSNKTMITKKYELNLYEHRLDELQEAIAYAIYEEGEKSDTVEELFAEYNALYKKRRIPVIQKESNIRTKNQK